jgi:N-acetylneuraminate synthase
MTVVKKLIDYCAFFNVDFVKFQKRYPDACVPDAQKDVMRDTPWGRMTYLDYRKKMELSAAQYEEIDSYCKSKNIGWFASVWDFQSLDFIAGLHPPFIKIPSACLTDIGLIKEASETRIPLILSTGMSDIVTVIDAVMATNNIACLMHCTSTYPSKPEEQNLQCITTLKDKFKWTDIGFSNHAPSIVPIILAMGLGATMIEVHITLSRAMWGSDHAASFEPEGIWKLVKYRDYVEAAMGDGVKKVYPSEIPIMQRLRRVQPCQ